MQQLRRFLAVVFFATAFAAPVQAQQTCGNQICEQGEDESNCPTDCAPSPICGDLICQPGAGEDALSCPSDCQPAGPVCGNNTCEAGEDIASCPADCGSQGPVCGNSACESGEDAQSCPVDCAGGGPVCGDNVCTPDLESCGNCIQDCPCWMPGTTCNPNPAPGVCENVCGNGLCGPGENAGNCSEDCPVQCGDSICSVGESCPADCAGCGDGFCDAGLGENDLSCSQDCSGGGACTVDGVCDAGAGENQQNCSPDCGGGPSCDFDNVCEAGENANSCPSDCSTSFVCGDNVCTPFVESCGNCLQDCPCELGTTCNPNPAPGICVAAPQLCGNGVLDPGETCENCLRDASSQLRFTLSTTTPQVGESVFLTPDFSTVGDDPIPRWDLGNGTTVTWPEPPAVWYEPGTYPVVMRGADLQCFTTQFSDPVFVTVSGGGGGGCDNNGVCDALENALNCPSDCTAPTCDFTDLPPNLQICCGDGICDSGENPNRCARDCPATCGDGLCSPGQGETNTSCSVDCCFSGNTCANGCAAVPYFEMSHSSVGALEVVTFTADPTNIVGTIVNWDFGDGEHCEQCPLTVTHRYSRTGTFPVRLTATEPVCGGAQVSFPQYLAVGAPPLRDDAQMVGDTIPACIVPGQGTTALVSVRNVGGTTWEARHGQELRRMGGAAILLNTFPLAPGLSVPPGGTVSFPVEINSPDATGDQTLTLQMGNVHGPFGDVLTSRIRISPDCERLSPPKVGDYTCRIQVSTPQGLPVPNVAVGLVAQTITELGPLSISDGGVTDIEGVAHLAVNRGSLPVHYVACTLSGVETTLAPVESIADPVDVFAPRHLDLVRTVRLPSAASARFPGLKNNVIASARLYQSGSYDMPVVIPAPFKRDEQDVPYTDENLYALFEPFVSLVHRFGLDIWLMRTTVGQNIHEQSAEFAQLIDYAARRLGPDGRVVVGGYSLGGVNTRLTTARYQADAAWRSDLALGRDDLPASLIAYGDAPLAGANIPMSFQSFLWGLPLIEGQAKVNLNTCGAQQLLQRSYPTLARNFQSFWANGSEVRFPRGNRGVCDRFEGSTCVCDAGPALFSVNGDGWAQGVRMVGYSDGSPGPQGCFGIVGDVNLDLDQKGKDVCPDLSTIYSGSRPFFPSIGSRMFTVQLPALPDIELRADSNDLVPGSRLSNSTLGGCAYPFSFSICAGLKQHFSPTFIPFDSALPPGAPFARTWWVDGYQGVHANSPLSNVLAWKDEALAAFAPSAPRPAATSAVLGATDQSVTATFPFSPDSLTVSAALTPEGPALPEGLVMAPGSGYYDIESSFDSVATRKDPIDVCIHYGATTFMDETAIRLYHHDGVQWEDTTSVRDREGRRICGVTTSLSPFAILEPANAAPVAPTYATLVLEAMSPAGADVTLLATGFRDPDGDSLTYTWSNDPLLEGTRYQSMFSIGTHSIVVSANDGRGRQATATRSVSVQDTIAPIVTLSVSGGRVRAFMANASDVVGVASLRITLDGETVAEGDGSDLAHALDTRQVSDGAHEVRAFAKDAAGNEASSAPITLVVDNTPPTLALSAAPAILWPPNGRLVPVTISLEIVDALDPAPRVSLLAVTCADVLKQSGAQRPCSPGDVQGAGIGFDDRSMALRARRPGDAERRVYVLTYSAQDSAGNEATQRVAVMVPHDQR